MLSFVFAVIVPFAFASAATTTDQMEYCKSVNRTLDLYQHPNVSSSYSIPALVSKDSTFENSTTQNWQIVDSIGTGPDPWNVSDPQAQSLFRHLFLDTSTTVNGSSSLPLAGCSFIFAGLTTSDMAETMEDGTCVNIFGSDCVNEMVQIAQKTTAAYPRPLGSSDLMHACDTVTQTVNNYIKTSGNACDKIGPSIAITQGFDFSTPNIDNCTNPPTFAPIALYEEDAPFQQGNFSTYDQWAKTPQSVLLTLFSNDSQSSNFAQTYLTCTGLGTVTAGSHDFLSAAERSAVVDVKVAVGVALAVNALVFLLL